MRIQPPARKPKDTAHATTAHNRVLRPQSSLRSGFRLRSGRGRFFLRVRFVSNIRPLIAIIEADATDRKMLCTLLSSLHVDVRVFDSAESYLDSCRIPLDCLIADAELPGMSGIELLRLLRSRGIEDPVILLGAAEDVRAAVTAMRAGALDFIEKTNIDLGVLRRVTHLLHENRPRIAH